jgi:hypothetical protein
MLKQLTLLFISLLPLCVVGQNDTTASVLEYKKHHWDSIPKLHQLSPEENKLSVVVIKDKRIVESSFDTNNNVAMYVTRHMIIRVNSDEAVEVNNVLYIPMGEGVSTLDIEARTIGKDGKVTLFNPSNIREVDNYQNMGPFKILAIDGLEKGGEVEYLYTTKEPFKLFGSEYIRMNAIHKDFEFDLYSPDNLVFDTKSYNGFPEMKRDTTVKNKRRLYLHASDIKGFDKEEFSADNGALMRLEYKFTSNTATDPDKKLYTYSDFCQRLYDLLDKSSDKKERKLAEKVVDTMKLDKLSEEDKIRKIESAIKSSVAMREDVQGDQYRSLADILKSHVSDEVGMLKLYHLLLDAAKINHEIVLTTSRFDRPFDGDFESWVFLQKYLFYFPETGQYIAPTEILSRYRFPPADWICQQGLFIHGVALGDFNTGVGTVKDIACNDYKLSMNDIFADTKFDLDMGVVNLHFKQTMTGYEAYNNGQGIYSYLSDDEKKQFGESVFKQTFPDAKPTNVKISGYKEPDLLRKPFVIEADFSTNSVLEKAGNKYLFKIGELIGPQSELYRDSVRHAPIENHNNHGYHRELAFEIPAGYKVTNLDAANMDVSDDNKGERTMEFHSYYKIDGNKVTVIIDEDYRELRYPVGMYEQFRKVINASADFNKVVLFLEKK